MFTIRRFPFFLLFVTALFSMLWVLSRDAGLVQAQPQAVDLSPSSTAAIDGPYKDLPVDAGVWNEGQAALWDLNILDHYHYFGPESRAKGYRPEQPIKFSHIVHVQKNKMECQYCHWSVAKASFAAIPEVEACMGCHKLITSNDPKLSEESKAEIKKLEEYWEKGEPIPWVKVHVNPQHVNFNHKRHVKAGLNCQECHGQVPNMSVVERVSSMKMGWCIDCHRTQGTSIDCWTCHH